MKPDKQNVTPEEGRKILNPGYYRKPTSDNEISNSRSPNRGRTRRDQTARPAYARHEIQPLANEFSRSFQAFRDHGSVMMRERVTESIRAMAILAGLL